MPISTIADALQATGANIANVMKEEGVRRQQALEAQAQTNELQYRQGLLGLESQKQVAAGQLGLAKAGAEARQWEVGSLQRNEEIANLRAFQDTQGRNESLRTGILRDTQTEQSRHNKGLEEVGRLQAAAAARQAAAAEKSAQAHAGVLEQQRLALKRQEQYATAPVDFTQWSNTFRQGVEATYGPETAKELLGQGSALWEAFFPDLEHYKDPKTGKYIMPQGLIDSRSKTIMETIGLRQKKGPVSESDMLGRIDQTYKSLLAEKDSLLNDEEKRTLSEVTHRYPTQLQQAMQMIDQNSKALLEQNRKTLLAQKAAAAHFWQGTPTLTEQEESDLIKKTILPNKEAEQKRAWRQLLITGGKDHGILPVGTPVSAPPPPTGTLPAGSPTPAATTPPPGAIPTTPSPSDAPGTLTPNAAPAPQAAQTPARFAMPEGGVPLYQPPSTPASSVDVYGAVGRVLSPLFAGPERGYKTPSVPNTDLQGPPVAVESRGPIGLAVEMALSGGDARASIQQALAGTRNGIYEVRVGRQDYRVVIQDGQLVSMGPAGP